MKTKSKSFLLPLFLVCAFAASGQIDCDFNNLPKEETYKVRLIEGTVESSDVKPRKLTDEEKCLVESARLPDKSLVIQLDMFTEVEVFPRNKTK